MKKSLNFKLIKFTKELYKMMVTLILDLTDLSNDKESKSIKFKFRRLILKNKMFVHFMDRSREMLKIM